MLPRCLPFGEPGACVLKGIEQAAQPVPQSPLDVSEMVRDVGRRGTGRPGVIELMPSWQFWWNWGAQVAIAVGTIAAVVVALFGDWLRGRLAPPKLVLKLRDGRGEKTPVTLTAPDGSTRETVGRWYHLRVENERRWSPARQVQVFLLRVEEPDAAGEHKITWVGEIPMIWRHQQVSPWARTIGYPADCDLCSVVKEKWVELHPVLVPFALNAQRREPCNLIVTLQARGLETDSNLVRVKIAWDGAWADDAEEMTRHMTVIEQSSPTRSRPRWGRDVGHQADASFSTC
jgi:hypothetical protein